ncbi:MAG: nuclear transport factor 2 family protein [Sphingomonadales bacterium]|nr:nuclear transport factor 2 family protein [Sphingomonadales bacterium]
MADDTAAMLAINQLYPRYTDAVWRFDYDAFADLFTDDAEWRISGRTYQGRAAIREAIAAILGPNFIRVRIVFGTPILTVASDGTASARMYMTEHCAWKSGERSISFGTYHDRFRLTANGWKFAWRMFELDYRGSPDLTGTWHDNPDRGAPPVMPDRHENTADHASTRWGLAQGERT